MEMRVNQIQQTAPVEQVQNTAPTDGSFKFMLASHVEEAELQERLTNLMAEITTEGEKLAKKRDVKDMRHYRGLVKEFLNEVVTRSHSFSRENFPDLPNLVQDRQIVFFILHQFLCQIVKVFIHLPDDTVHPVSAAAIQEIFS